MAALVSGPVQFAFDHFHVGSGTALAAQTEFTSGQVRHSQGHSTPGMERVSRRESGRGVIQKNSHRIRSARLRGVTDPGQAYPEHPAPTSGCFPLFTLPNNCNQDPKRCLRRPTAEPVLPPA